MMPSTSTGQVGFALVPWMKAAKNEKVTISTEHILVEDDFTNRYIPINDTIIGVKRVIPLTQLHSNNMFSIEYQMRLNDVYHLNQLDLVSYHMAQSHISMINDLLHTTNNIAIRYNRHLNKLSLDMDWNKLGVGDIIIIEVFAT